MIAKSILVWLALAAPPVVSAESGNIVVADAGGEPRRLTTGGRDTQPSLSPDGKLVVFVRGGDGTVVAGSGDVEANSIWIVDVEGKQPRLLVKSAAHANVEQLLGALSAPQFSPDGKSVYFTSAAWATSGAVHRVDVATGVVRFVSPGNSLEVLRAGQYAGHLVVQKHKYFLGGGSYDWFWLLTPDGKEVDAIGDDPASFREVYGR
jgi:dipeptidyl aminopeptidase/acylaminoacyl peptidase